MEKSSAQQQRSQTNHRSSNGRPPPPRPPPPSINISAASTASSSSSQSSLPNTLSEVKTFQQFKTLSDAVHKYVDSALLADEQGSKELAMESYLEGQRLIELALQVDCDSLIECSPNRKDQAKALQLKMNKTKQHIFYRLKELLPEAYCDSQTSMFDEAAALPSYEEAINESTPPAYIDDQMMQLGDDILSEEIADQLKDGTALFSLEDVQIFYISPEGLVSAPSYPSTLNIVQLPEDTLQSGGPPAFLHIGDWMYPLIPGTSPALRTNYGAYLFPDVMSQAAGSAVGVMLPLNLPEPERARFEQLIQSFTVMERQEEQITARTQQTASSAPKPVNEGEEEEEEEEEKDLAKKISEGIITGAEWFAWGVGKGAEKAGELIKAGSKRLREKTSPATAERTIDPRIQQGVQYAKRATAVTVTVSGFIVRQLGQATMALGRQVAPYVRDQGVKYLPKDFTKPSHSSGKSTMDGVVEVAASGLQGIGTVYLGLEAAGKSLGKSLATETVQVIKHKYGNEAGVLANDSLCAAGNAAMTVYNSGAIGVKAVAKRAAKDTGKAVIYDMHSNKKGNTSSSVDQSKNNTDGKS